MFQLSAFSDEAGKTLKEQIAALKRNSLCLTELRTVDGVNIADINEKQAKEYASVLKNEGISLSAIGSPIGKVNLNADFNAHLDTAKKLFEFCNIFGTDKIRVFSFYYDIRECNTAWVCDSMRTLCYIGKTYGVTLYLENEKGVMGDTAENCRDILFCVPELKFVFDPANFVQCGERVIKALSVLKDKIAYAHIKDIDEKSGEIVPAGEGDGKIAEIVNFLDSKNNNVILTVEPHLAVFDGYGAIDKHQLKNRYRFQSNGEAFDCAVSALKNLLLNMNFKEKDGVWTR